MHHRYKLLLRRRSRFLSTRSKYPIPITSPTIPNPATPRHHIPPHIMAYTPPTRRDTAAFNAGFSQLKLDTDDPYAIDNFHTWKKQFEIGFKSSQLGHQLLPPVGDAADSNKDEGKDYVIWDQQLLSILSMNVSGSQLANVILPCDTGQKSMDSPLRAKSIQTYACSHRVHTRTTQHAMAPGYQ